VDSEGPDPVGLNEGQLAAFAALPEVDEEDFDDEEESEEPLDEELFDDVSLDDEESPEEEPFFEEAAARLSVR